MALFGFNSARDEQKVDHPTLVEAEQRRRMPISFQDGRARAVRGMSGRSPLLPRLMAVAASYPPYSEAWHSAKGSRVPRQRMLEAPAKLTSFLVCRPHGRGTGSRRRSCYPGYVTRF